MRQVSTRRLTYEDGKRLLLFGTSLRCRAWRVPGGCLVSI